jgi:hypothetical protein
MRRRVAITTLPVLRRYLAANLNIQPNQAPAAKTKKQNLQQPFPSNFRCDRYQKVQKLQALHLPPSSSRRVKPTMPSSLKYGESMHPVRSPKATLENAPHTTRRLHTNRVDSADGDGLRDRGLE